MFTRSSLPNLRFNTAARRTSPPTYSSLMFFLPRMFLLSLLVILCSAPVHSAPLSLQDCTTRALRVSEDLAQRRLAIEQARARYRQAINSLTPDIGITVQQQLRGPSNFGVLRSAGSDLTSDPTGARSRGLGSSQLEAAFTVQQPLFRGFREFILADVALAEQEGLTAIERRNRELLYQDVATTFHQSLLYQDDISILERSKANLVDRIKELHSFVSLGRTRESEVIAAQSDLAAVAVTKERVKGLRQASLEYLAFLIDLPSEQIELIPNEPQFQSPALSVLLEKSRLRSDALSADAALRVAHLRTLAIRRELWPEATLEGSVYGLDDPDRSREWQVLLRLDIPIFTFGKIEARASESELIAEAAQSARERIRRQVELEVRQAVSRLVSATAQYRALETLVASRRKNHELQRQDYTLGVVTNLEVLNAIRDLYDSERQLREAKATVAVEESNLAVAVGGMSL